MQKHVNLLDLVKIFFFPAQAVEEALRKDRDCPVEKETPKRRGASGHEEAQPPPPDVESWLRFSANF